MIINCPECRPELLSCSRCDNWGKVCDLHGRLDIDGLCGCETSKHVKVGQKLIFLDFDGVLNSSEYYRKSPDSHAEFRFASVEWYAATIDERAVSYLNTIVEKTGAVIVFSTSWRTALEVGFLQEILELKGFEGKSVGRTPWLRGRNRCDEIQQVIDYLNHRDGSVPPFVILDDDQEAGIPDHFVQTHFENGLVPEQVEEAITVLTG